MALVDKDVNAAEFLNGLRNRLFNFVFVADITNHTESGTARGFYLSTSAAYGARKLRMRVTCLANDRNACTVACRPQHDGETNASSGTCNKKGSARKCCVRHPRS